MKKHKEHKLLISIRILLGLVFIFSSTVKGIDPVGTSYRMQDYLMAYGWDFLLPYAMTLSIILILSEFLLGIAFLFRLFMKTATKAMLLMLAFFTVVTFLNALNNWVPDCGCFGDAIILSNWATFYKNIVLILLSLWVLIYWIRKPAHAKFIPQLLVLLLIGGGYLGFVEHNLNHLPIIDFRDWKTGRDMKASGLDKAKTYVTYQNKKTGEKKEFLFPHYPWKDTAWMAQWQFLSQRVDDSQVIRKHNLIIEDSLGNNLYKEIVENPGNQFILVADDLSKSNMQGLKKAASLYRMVHKRGISMVLLTSSDYPTIRAIEDQLHTAIPSYQTDDIELKIMIRSNPGLLWLKNGRIQKKWHYHDFPSPKVMEKRLFSSDK